LINRFNEITQWIGACTIIAGHVLNSIGPTVYPFNIIAFLIGTIAFLIWSIRVHNRPQLVVNIVALLIGIVGIIRAIIN